MKDTIKKIWDNRLEGWVHKGSWDEPEILATNRAREALYKRLFEELTKEQIDLLDEYLSQRGIIENVEQRSSFIRGFSLGVRLVAEVFAE